MATSKSHPGQLLQLLYLCMIPDSNYWFIYRLDDLVVGAPYHANLEERIHEVGKVYVFYQEQLDIRKVSIIHGKITMKT